MSVALSILTMAIGAGLMLSPIARIRSNRGLAADLLSVAVGATLVLWVSWALWPK